MIQAAECRELFVLDSLDVPVHGTFHKAADYVAGQDGSRIGLVFLNGLLATRSGHGDAVAWWADCFAEAGYSCFRLDLPACGDSPGEPPGDWLAYINAGGYAMIAAAKIRELATRFHLSGVVLVGQCAGAVTAIFAAADLSECRGLILMEPYFFLPSLPSSEFRMRLHLWRLQSRIGGLCGSVYQRLKAMRMAVGGSALPESANAALLDCWEKVTSAGLPILILEAPNPGGKPLTDEFDCFAYFAQKSGTTNKITVAVIEGANHTFTNRPGRDAIRERTEGWLRTRFPLATTMSSPSAGIERSGLISKLAAKTSGTVFNQ